MNTTYCVVIRDRRFNYVYATFETENGAFIAAAGVRGGATTRRGFFAVPKSVSVIAVATASFRRADYEMTESERASIDALR